MNLRQLAIAALSALATAASAETVLLYEDFDGDYSKSFPYMYDGDRQQPHSSIANIFYSNVAGMYMPWWLVKDSNESPDRFMASHSYYQGPGQSNDWLISVPLYIESEGFDLEFDAQSVNVRGADHISSLSLFITNDLIDVANLPTEPTYVWEEIPYGNDPDNCEYDWTHFFYSLDAYAGQTIYINFVNNNTDKDIICIDNVKVARFDPVEISIEDLGQYTPEQQITANAKMEVVAPDGIYNWALDLVSGGQSLMQWSGENNRCGEELLFEAPVDLEVGEPTEYSFVFVNGDGRKMTLSKSITRLAFETTHRVFFEETTSLHCGNCPMGIYVVESMLEDEELGDRIVPVSVHIASLGTDPMATQDYFLNLPNYQQAPIVYVERSSDYDGFIPAYDGNYDSSNPNSFAYRIAQLASQLVPLDVEVEGSWVVNGSDTTAVQCKARIKPAINLAGKEYRIAFILTENNVGIDNNVFWRQENYMSGADFESRVGGWADLGSTVKGMRYHDVARAISQYGGHPFSLPLVMNAGEEYEFACQMAIPQTYSENSATGYLLSESIRTDFLDLSAIVIDGETGMVVNAARVPLGDLDYKRFTAKDLVEQLGVVGIETDESGPAAYYDLQGRKVANPEAYKGVLIKVSGTKASKIIAQ